MSAMASHDPFFLDVDVPDERVVIDLVDRGGSFATEATIDVGVAEERVAVDFDEVGVAQFRDDHIGYCETNNASLLDAIGHPSIVQKLEEGQLAIWEALRSLKTEMIEKIQAIERNSDLQEPVERYVSHEHFLEQRQSGITNDDLEVEGREFYEFQGSTWDVIIFIATPSLGVCGSVVTCTLLLVKVVMQLVFVGIVWFNFSEATVNENTIENARRWRISSAHDYQHMDLKTGHSLVSRVCENDKSLQIASSQEQLYGELRDYLKHGATGLESFFVGKTLCVVALLCWFLMVAKELNSAADLLRGMMHVDRGADKLEPVERPGHITRYRLASVTVKRLIFSAIIVAYRFFICGVLGVSGTYFLVYTVDITELVLNAVALEIILNIDDLLFAAMSTSNAKFLLSMLEPLEMKRWPHRKGVDVKTVSTAGIIFGGLVCVYYTMITPMVDDLNKVADALCGGTRNFVYSNSPLKMTLFATTPPCTNGCQPMNDVSSVKKMAVQEALRYGTMNKSEYAIWVGDHHALHHRILFSFEQAVAYVSRGRCADNLEGPYRHYMRQIMANESISECSDIKSWCSSASFEPEWGPDGGKGLMARLMCPRTCECDDPGGGRIFISGCPAACTQKSHPWYAQRLNVSCLQENETTATNPSAWIAWAAQVRQYAAFKNDNGMILYSDQMVSMGCEIAWRSPDSGKCKWDAKYKSVFKGLAFYCPQRCECYWREKKPACPDPCLHRRRRRRRRRT